jgi:ribosomal protein S18 acetylase RimI-like enzyme
VGTPQLVTEDEFGAVGDLVVRAYEQGGVLATDDGYRSVLADTRGRAAQAEVYVVHDDIGRPVATVTLSPHSTAYAQVAAPGELEFRMLAVDPEAAGQGLGSSLVGFCADQALARGDNALVLCVIDTNATAIRLYKRLGFVHRPERDVQVGPGVRLLVLTRALRTAGEPNAQLAPS